MSLELKNGGWGAMETPGLREMLKDKLTRSVREGKFEESLDVMDVIDVLDAGGNPMKMTRAGREIAEAAMRAAKERHATLQHCRFWSFHKQAFLCYDEWIKESWDDGTESNNV